MSDYKCLLAGGPDSENSHDLFPKLMEPQAGLMSPFRHRPRFQGRGRGGSSGPDTGLRVGLQEEESGIPVRRHLLHPEESSRWHMDEPAPFLSK